MTDQSFFGAKSGGSYKRTPDNLFTTDVVEVVLGISEGPIKGLKDGSKSFYLGDTPLTAADGSNNFESFQLRTYPGEELQGEEIKSLIGGFGSPTNVGVNLSQNLAVTRSGVTRNIDYIDVRLLINALIRTSDKGEYAHSGQIRLEYKRSQVTTWTPVTTMTNLADQELPFLGGSYDTAVVVATRFPATTSQAVVLRKDEGYKAYRVVAGVWTAAPTSEITVVVRERPEYGPNQLNHLINIFGRHRALIWVKPSNDEVRLSNGTSWVVPGSSLRPNTAATTTVLPNGVVEIRGKTTTGAVQEYRIPVPRIDNDTYDVRLTVISGQDTDGDNNPRFDVTWESLQEVSARAFRFPGLAVTQVAGRSSDQLSSLPELSGVYQGRIVRVPSNYNPVTRVYTGTWNGAWKFAYTNNPAYIGNDLVMNDRYGMNAYYPVTLNKYDVYDAGVWADTKTADDTPRFTFNGLISEPMNGREAIHYVFGIMGARFFDDGNGQAVLRLDKPQNPVAVFAPENVIDGVFTYSFSGISTQYNDITVNFINPELNWKQDKRRVYDQEHINKYGRVPKTFTAVGCTNVSEAIRRAKYQLVTSLTERTSVSFKTNRQGLFVTPYDLILIGDPNLEFGWSGRIRTTNNTTKVFTFRDPIFLEAGFNYVVHFTVPNAAQGFETFTMQLAAGQTGSARTSFTVVGSFPTNIPEDAQFTIGTVDTNAAPKPFRVMSITPEGDNEDIVTIEAIEVNRVKWSYIDGHVDTIPVDVTGSSSSAAPLPVTSLDVMGSIENNRRILTVRWGASPTNTVTNYKLAYSRNGDPFTDLGSTRSLRYVLPGMLEGDYMFSLVAVDANGLESAARYTRYEVDVSEDSDLPLIANLNVQAITGLTPDGSFQAYLRGSWTPVSDAQNVVYDIAYRRSDETVFHRTQSREAGFRSSNIDGNSDYVIEVSARVGNIPLRAVTSTTVSVAGDDTIPDVPTGWTAEGGLERIELYGDASAESDFKEFIIYWSAAPTGPFAELARTASTAYTHYTDARTYYRVAQQDRSGNVSPQTATFDAAPIVQPDVDVEPPARPAGLTVTSTLDRLTAAWTANGESDLSHYEVELVQNGGTPVGYVTPTNRYEWASIPRNLAVTVRVRAVDQSGWKSLWTDPVSHTTARDTIPPAVPTGLAIRAGFNTLWVDWTRNTEADFSHYEVAVGDATAPTTVVARTPANSFVLTELPDNTAKFIRVLAVDTSGNKSGWSATVTKSTVTPPDPTITTDKLVGLIDSTSFGTGVQPITIWTGAALPTTKQTDTISWNGKLYRWNGTAYIDLINASDLAGKLTATQFAAGIEPVSIHTGVALPTIKATTSLLWNGKLYRWNVDKYTPDILGTDAVVAGTVAAGAINTRELAAGAVRASNVLVTTGDNLILDAEYNDIGTSANTGYWFTNTTIATFSTVEGQSTTYYGQPRIMAVRNIVGAGTGWTLLQRSPDFSVQALENIYVSLGFWNNRAAKVWARLLVKKADGTDAKIITLHTGNIAAGSREVSVSDTIPADGVTACVQFYADRDTAIATPPSDFNIGRWYVRRMVDARLVVHGSIESNHVAANAIQTAHLDAGVVTTQKLAIGFGGNLIANSNFLVGVTGWELGRSGAVGTESIMAPTAPAGDYAGRDYPTLEIRQSGVSTTGYVNVRHRGVKDSSGAIGWGWPVSADDWLEASLQAAALRCAGELRIEWRNEAGTVLNYSPPTALPVNNAASTTNPDLWPRLWVKGQAPANAAYGLIHIRKLGTTAGATPANSSLYVHKPMLALSSAERSEATPYAPGSFTFLDGNGLITDSVKARSIDVVNLLANIATINEAFIKTAHVVELSAAVLTAGSAMAGSITVDGRALATTAGDLLFDDVTLPWNKIAGAGTGQAAADGGALATGTQVMEINANGASWWESNGHIPFDPNKLYKVSFSIKRVSGTTGVFQLALTGLAADRTARVNTAGANAITDPHVLQGSTNQSTVGTGYTDFVFYVKGQSSTPGGTGTIAAPYKVHPNVRFLRPLAIFNNGLASGGSVMRLNHCKIEALTEEAAALVNAGSTKIDPGLVTVKGTTTLSTVGNWLDTNDATRINGGWLANDTITTEKLLIGNRNLTLTNIQFEHNRSTSANPAANNVWWSAGQIRWVNDDGVTVHSNIPTGSAAWTSGTVLYVCWTKPTTGTTGQTTALTTTTSQSEAFRSDRVILATYEGGTKLDADYGRTVIDGSGIKAKTITGDLLVTNQAVIKETAQIENLVVSYVHLKGYSVAKIIKKVFHTRPNGEDMWRLTQNLAETDWTSGWIQVGVIAINRVSGYQTEFDMQFEHAGAGSWNSGKPNMSVAQLKWQRRNSNVSTWTDVVGTLVHAQSGEFGVRVTNSFRALDTNTTGNVAGVSTLYRLVVRKANIARHQNMSPYLDNFRVSLTHFKQGA